MLALHINENVNVWDMLYLFSRAACLDSLTHVGSEDAKLCRYYSKKTDIYTGKCSSTESRYDHPRMGRLVHEILALLATKYSSLSTFHIFVSSKITKNLQY